MRCWIWNSRTVWRIPVEREITEHFRPEKRNMWTEWLEKDWRWTEVPMWIWVTVRIFSRKILHYHSGSVRIRIWKERSWSPGIRMSGIQTDGIFHQKMITHHWHFRSDRRRQTVSHTECPYQEREANSCQPESGHTLLLLMIRTAKRSVSTEMV